MTRASRRPARSFVAGFALILLSGCATVPKLGPQSKPASASDFASRRSLPSEGGAWPAVHWWSSFGDPQLDRLVAEALANSPTLEQAAARIGIASAQADAARAALLPKAGLLATARYSRITQSIGLPTDGKWHLLGAALVNASYDLDLWGKNRAGLRAAVSERKAAEADDAAAQLTLATTVASTYVDLAQLYLKRDAAAEALRLRKASLDLVERRFKVGLDTRTAVEQAEASSNGAAEELAALDEAIALNRNALAALVGAGPDRGLDLTRPSLDRHFLPALPDDLAVGLVGRRPDLIAARWKVEAAAQRIGVARAGFYPNVSLAGLIGFASFGLSNLFKQASVIGSAGPAISLPIFDGGRLSANYRGARANYELAVSQYDSTLLGALHEAADAATSLRALAARKLAADRAVADQEAAYRLIQLRYRGGLADYQAVLTVENALVQARADAADLQLRAFTLDVALVKALGGGFAGNAPTDRNPVLEKGRP